MLRETRRIPHRRHLPLQLQRPHEQLLPGGGAAGQIPRHRTLRAQGAREDVQVAQQRGDGVAAVAEELLGGLLVVADVVWVVEDGGLADGDEVVEEALAGVGEG